MKKLFTLLAIVLASVPGFAQTDTDSYTIHKKDGTTEKCVIKDENHLQFTDANTLVNYMTGFDSFGANKTWNVNDIDNITFSVYHEADVSDVNLADKDASDKTKKLYKFLEDNYGTKTISAVTADVNWNHKIADQIGTKTGKYPAINLFDFIHVYVPDNNGWIDYNDLTPVTEWADAGGIVALMWHFNVPKSETTEIKSNGDGVTCTPSETTFRAKNALTDGTWENKWYTEQMEKVENILLKLQDAGIVAIWRPYHEAAGNATLKSGDSWGTSWFWWGYDGADVFKDLWRDMFNKFQVKGIHNLIWVWTSQNFNGNSSTYNNDADWYPGDEYVDIIGRDLYGYDAKKQAQEFSELQQRYPGKIITLAECGVESKNNTPTADVQTAWDGGAKWSWFMPWYGGSMPTDSWWNKVMNSDIVITREDLNK